MNDPLEIVRRVREMRARWPAPVVREPSYCEPDCRCAQWDKRMEHLRAQQARGVMLGIVVPDRPICWKAR